MSERLIEIPPPSGPRMRYNRVGNPAALEAAQRALGRIGTEENPNAVLIPRDRIRARTKQPRHDVTNIKIHKKREELKADGQLANLIVEPDPDRSGFYILIDGELRWRASKADTDWVGLEVLKCEIREDMEAQAAYIMAAKANDGTEPLTDYDWCLTVRDLHEDFGMTLTEINKTFKKGRNWASQLWAVWNESRDLPAELQDEFMGRLKHPGNFIKAHRIVTAAISAHRRNQLARAFDEYTVERVDEEIKKWKDEQKPAPVSAPAAPPSQEPATRAVVVSGSTTTPPVTQAPTATLWTAPQESPGPFVFEASMNLTRALELVEKNIEVEGFFVGTDENLKRAERALKQLRMRWDAAQHRE